MRPIITHFTDDDLYKFTMCCAVIDNYPRAQVKYVFNDRDNTVYPDGFAAMVMEQVGYLEELRITDEEVAFMKRKCYYLPDWFYIYLRGFRYKREWVKAWQDDEGHLHIEFEGQWAEVILLEVKVLAIVSELYYIVTGQDGKFDYDSYFAAGCKCSDFGTRRRASFRTEDVVVRAMKDARQGPGLFVGTSNVYLAMKHDLTPVGTMAHEFIAAIGGMYGPQMANHIAMNAWRHTFSGALGTFLYDTFGWSIFALNFSEDFANLFKGLRVDSGDNMDQLRKICAKYESLGIDPRTKQVIFSNALDTDSVIDLQKKAETMVQPSFGIGTNFTNDYDGIHPMNIVIKLVAVKITESWPFYNDTCKISEDDGKHTGKPEVIRRFMDSLHLK